MNPIEIFVLFVLFVVFVLPWLLGILAGIILSRKGAGPSEVFAMSIMLGTFMFIMPVVGHVIAFAIVKDQTIAASWRR